VHVALGSLPRLAQSMLAPITHAHLDWLQPPTEADALEAVLRPALLPNEQWGDVERFRGNPRLLSWLRSAYLQSHPAVRAALPSAELALEHYPNVLPTAAEVRSAFGTSQPNGRWPPPARSNPPPPPAPGSSTAGTSLGLILEAGGGLVAGRGAFGVWAEKQGVYEMLTTEFVDSLAQYLQARLSASSAHSRRSDSGPGPRNRRVVLDAGAGDGALATHLHTALGGGASVSMVACDNFTTNPPGGEANAASTRAVMKMHYRRALQVHAPEIVLCAWMPMGVDWSAAFRGCDSVHEYILLGECDDGAVGCNWATWGNPLAQPAGTSKVTRALL